MAAAALGDPNRLRIVRVLLEGPLCVNQIVDVLELRQPLVSHHLSTLAATGLIQSRRNGRNRFYSISNPGPVWGPRLVDLLFRLSPTDAEDPVPGSSSNPGLVAFSPPPPRIQVSPASGNEVSEQGSFGVDAPEPGEIEDFLL